MAFSEDQIKILSQSRNDFNFFLNKIFSLSFKHFIRGEHLTNTAIFLSQNKKTMRVSAKGHMKSTSLYAHFMWKLLHEGASNDIEAHYFSYQETMAGYHVKKIKETIADNPYFEDLIDLKPTAESTIKYTWDRKHFISIQPHGLLAFKRGLHGDYIYVDDPFQDPENELTFTTILKINEIFKSNILDMPKTPDGELHVVGTPQTKEDFFFNKNITKRFKVKMLPAIKEGKALWPESMDLEELRAKKEERGEKIFSREYLCNPVYSTKGFFKKDYLQNKAINSSLTNLNIRKKYETSNDVIAGFDIGKKTNPSHLSVFEIRDKKWIMIHHKWMDGWPYSNGSSYFEPNPTQLEYLKMAIDHFKIDKLYFDNTRGEFEAFIEQALTPPQMIPVIVTLKFKTKVASEFDRMVENEEIEIIEEDRLIDQICAVTNDLKAMETPKGHGDSFWSIAYALSGRTEIEYASKDHLGITTGGRSIFSEGHPIPPGW